MTQHNCDLFTREKIVGEFQRWLIDDRACIKDRKKADDEKPEY